jgi:hypothetical protein
MPAEMKSASASVTEHSRAPGSGTLVIAATLAIAMFHLVSGVMLDRSHARPAIEPTALAALDDEARCSADVRSPERSLPYD